MMEKFLEKCFCSFHLLVVLLMIQEIMSSKPMPQQQPQTTTAVAPENVFVNLTMNFDPFHATISKLLKDNALPTPDCDIPSDAIMFSYTNRHTFAFVKLQHDAMDVGGVRSCLEKRFITVCLDNACKKECDANNIPNCIVLKLPDMPYSQFGGQGGAQATHSYNYLTWLKHELFFEAFKVAGQAFYFDADVVVMRNPWPEVKFGRDKDGKRISSTYDAMYQRERGIGYKSCAGSANGGVVYFLNSTAYHRQYYSLMVAQKIPLLEGKTMTDQDLMGQLIHDAGLRYCTFPVSKFMGHCEWSRDRGFDATQLITYHPNCVGGMKNKISRMEEAMKAAGSKDSSVRDWGNLRQRVRHP